MWTHHHLREYLARLEKQEGFSRATAARSLLPPVLQYLTRLEVVENRHRYMITQKGETVSRFLYQMRLRNSWRCCPLHPLACGP